MAASSTEMLRTVMPSVDVGRRPRPAPRRRKRRTSTLANERFIALLIKIESRKPLAPSSAPAMISTLFRSAKPVADEASPA